jgi:hypothetical protein
MKTATVRVFLMKYRIQYSIEIYSSVSEKPTAEFCRANFSLQNLLYQISSECNQVEICESSFPYILNYVTVFTVLTMISSFLDDI